MLENISQPQYIYSMKISIFIDSCAWNFLYEHNIDLATEFPSEHFRICMTAEVNRFEIKSIPREKVKLVEYIRQQEKNISIHEDAFFGFATEDKPRNSGFDQGRFASYEDTAAITENEKNINREKIKGSGLYHDEADVSLVIRAQTGSIVLTTDTKGPLKKEAEKNKNIIFLYEFTPESKTLRNFVLSKISVS